MAILNGDLATTRFPGKIRVATNAEAAAGTNVVAAVTPAQLSAAVANGVGAVSGGLVYRGVFDASTGLPSLANGVKGDFYKISVAGTFLGIEMNVGDNLIVNADMGGVVVAGKIDLIDNTEAILGIDDLKDVDTTGAAAGQYLKYDGDEWVDSTIQIADVSGLQTDLTAKQIELNLIEASVGLTASGGLSPFTLTGVVAGKPHFKAAIDALSVELNSVDSERVATQAELDLSQASLGLLPSGSLSPFTLTGAVAGKLTHKAAIDALSVELLDARTDLQAELDLSQASLGLLPSGSLSPFTLTGVVAGKLTFKAAIDALSASGLQQGNDIFATQSEMDLTQASLGLLPSGSLSPFSGVFTTGKTTHKAAIEGLDARLNQKPDHVVYVSGEFGNNTYDGALYTPKQTIAAALASLPNNGTRATIYLFPGAYAENLTVTRVNTTIAGLSAAGRAGHITTISGSIDIAPTVSAGGVFNNFVIFENLQVGQSGANPAVNLGGTFLYQAHFRNCQIFSNGIDTHLVSTSTTVDSRLYFFNCALNLTGNSAFHTISMSKGQLFVDLCEIYRSGGTAASRAIVLSGTASAPRMATVLLTVSGCSRAVEAAGVGNNITLGNSVIGNSTANSTGVFLGAGALFTAVYTLFDVATAAGTGHVVDGAAGAVFVHGYNLFANDTTIGASVTRVPLAKDLATVATTGAYSDLSGKPVLAAVATSGLASDVSVSGAPVNFTTSPAATQTVEAFLDGIDAKIGTMDLAIAGAGAVSTVNGVAPDGAKNVLIDGSDIKADHLGVNYVGSATLSIKGHLSAIDTVLGAKATTVNGVSAVNGVITFDADSLVADRTGTNYTADSTLSVKAHLAAIDTALGAAGAVSTVNGVAPDVAKNVLIDGDDIAADRIGVNYSATAPQSVKQHLAAIDTALGAAGAVATVNGVAPDVAKNVLIDADDIAADRLAVNYTGAAASSVKTHLGGIDTKIGSMDVTISGKGVVNTVNSVAAIGSNVLIDADDIAADRLATNYTGAAVASIKTHLGGIDTALGGKGVVNTVNSVAAVGANVLIDADDIAADRLATNYTGLVGNSIKTHLAGIDTALGEKATTVNGVSAVAGVITFDADELVADRSGIAYTATPLQSVKQHLSAIDTALSLRVKSVNGVSPDGTGAVVFDADSLVADRNGTNYTAASTLSVKAHLAAIDAALGGVGGASGGLTFVKNTASLTALANTHHSVDTTAGVIAVTIPALNAVGISEGTRIRVRLTIRGGTNNVTITSPSPLNGATSPIILSVVGEHIEFLANKTDNVWEII